MSSYCSFGNNPIYYIDPDGREIIDPQGNRVTYTIGEDGLLTWSQNATIDIKRIGNAMARSEEGLRQLGLMQSATHKVYLNIDRVSKPPGKDGYTDKEFSWDNTNNTFVLYSATVTIYEANLKEFAEKINNRSIVPRENQGRLYARLSNDIDAMIASVASHEAVHASDMTNITQSLHNKKLSTTHDVEQAPEEVETRVLNQLILRQEQRR